MGNLGICTLPGRDHSIGTAWYGDTARSWIEGRKGRTGYVSWGTIHALDSRVSSKHGSLRACSSTLVINFFAVHNGLGCMCVDRWFFNRKVIDYQSFSMFAMIEQTL